MPGEIFPPAGIPIHMFAAVDVTTRVNNARTVVAVVDVRRAKINFSWCKVNPAGIPICIAIIIHASARTYKICIIISIVDTRRAPPAGIPSHTSVTVDDTIIVHVARMVAVVAEVRRAKINFSW